jgi:uncharacterized membrane protein
MMNRLEDYGHVFAAKFCRGAYACATAAMVISFASGASAGDIVKITLCNETPRPVFAAIAYSHEHSMTSQGWFTVATDGCVAIPGNYRLSTFYFRGETDSYQVRGGEWRMDTWGDGSDNKQFLVQDDGFKFAEGASGATSNGARFEKFSEFFNFASLPITRGDPQDTEARITFKPNGGMTQVAELISEPAPDATPGGAFDARAAQQLLGPFSKPN